MPDAAMQNVEDMSWSGRESTGEHECRALFAFDGSPQAAVAHQRTIADAAISARFEIAGVAIMPARTPAEMHLGFAGDPAEGSAGTPAGDTRSGIQIVLRYRGNIVEALDAMHDLVASLPDQLELVDHNVGQSRDGFGGSRSVVVLG